MIFNNIAIKLKSFNDFNKVQEIAFKVGLKWHFSKSEKQYTYANHGRLNLGTVILIKDKNLYISNIQNSKKNNYKIIDSELYIANYGLIKKKTTHILNI